MCSTKFWEFLSIGEPVDFSRRIRLHGFGVAQLGPTSPLRWGFEITLRHTTVRRNLDDGSARRRDIYPRTPNIHRRQIFVPSAGFEPAIPASEGPQSYALDHEATGIGRLEFIS